MPPGLSNHGGGNILIPRRVHGALESARLTGDFGVTKEEMVDTVEQIEHDKRTISHIVIGTGEEIYSVGLGGITKIAPYYAAGEMANVTWFAVYRGNFLSVRCNGKYVSEVGYTPEPAP
jgi:hypothetical protein